MRSKKYRTKTEFGQRRKNLGLDAVSKGLCRACLVSPIFYTHSKCYCESCFSNRKKANLEYKNSHKDLENLRHKKWLDNHPEKWIEYGQRRRIRKTANGGNFSNIEWKELKNKYSNKCLWCGNYNKITADHVVPISRGGTNWISNIQPLCRSCNSKKGVKIIDFRPFGSAIMEWT